MSVRASAHCRASSKCLSPVWSQVRTWPCCSTIPVTIRRHETGLASLLSSSWGREKSLTPKENSTCSYTKASGPFLSYILWAPQVTRLRASQRPSAMFLCQCCGCSSFWGRFNSVPPGASDNSAFPVHPISLAPLDVSFAPQQDTGVLMYLKSSPGGTICVCGFIKCLGMKSSYPMLLPLVFLRVMPSS